MEIKKITPSRLRMSKVGGLRGDSRVHGNRRKTRRIKMTWYRDFQYGEDVEKTEWQKIYMSLVLLVQLPKRAFR